MGTAAFAVPIFNRLITSQHKIVALYTKPPTKQSRGMSLQKSPTHTIADCSNIPVYTPKTFRNQLVIEEMLKIDADVVVVVAYGSIIPESILEEYKFGCINIHPSDLPRWRGAAPIQRSMMAGDDTSAVCIMQMDSGIDTGPIYSKKQFILDKTKNIHQLTVEYAEIGAEMLLDVLDKIENNNLKPEIQNNDGATYASKILPEDEKINFNDTAVSVHGKIMALTPNAYFIHNELKIKAVESILIDKTVDEDPGSVISKQFEIACGDNKVVQITKLQRPGGKILDTQAFLCGYKIPINIILN